MKVPNTDFQLLENLYPGKSVDKETRDVTFKIFLSHLWYLRIGTIALAFFYMTIFLSKRKAKCVLQILRENEASDTNDEIYDDEDDEKRRKEEKNLQKRVEVKLFEVQLVIKKGLEQSITARTKIFFIGLTFFESFFSNNSVKWNDNLQYMETKEMVMKFKVVNGTAERERSILNRKV